jgi:uncharacterized protein YutE (UPF0331/DUF86 family)
MKELQYTTSDIFHYSNHLLLDVFPLTKSEYKRQSVYRRASYDYLNQIIEATFAITDKIMISMNIQNRGKTYHERFTQAQKVGLLPLKLAHALLDLKKLRNTAVHKNPAVNDSLMLFDKLITLIAVGFAASEILSTFENCIRNGVSDKYNYKCVIDRSFFSNWLCRSTKIDNEENAEEASISRQYHESKKKALKKLTHIADVPVFEITDEEVRKAAQQFYRSDRA